jgi:glycopeptide antibiotics resistance protein
MYIKDMNENTKPLVAGVFLVAYLAVLLRLFVFKFTVHLPSGVVLKLGGYGDYGYNLVPFRTIFEYLSGYPWGMIVIANLLGNIILFMPLGFLLPLVYRPVSWKGVLGISVAFSLCIEILQLVLRAGASDVDDIILNALGGVLGYVAFMLFATWMRSSQRD